MSDPRTGGCLCGAIRYETVGEPVFSLRCHCRDCQRQSGAAHVPAARVPSAGFRILQGTPKRYVTKADSGNDIVRVFCGNCGTPLYVQVGNSPRPRRTSRLHFRRPWLVQAGCRHFHEERTTLGPRPAQRAEARHLPAWTILPDPAVARWIATDHCDAGLWPISVPWGSCPSRWCRFVVCREGIHWRINPVGVAADWSVGCDGRRE